VCVCVYKPHMDWPGIKSSSLWGYANK